MKARLSRRHTAARVFGVELVSLLQSGEDQAPQVVRMCTAFVERHGLVDGIYRLSGVASNTKRLREEFDAGRVPDLTRSVYMRDVHCVSSLCKQFFRDLPEPLLTYHLFHLFDEAVRAPSVEERLQKIHHAIHQLPLPHYNTLEFLISHLSHMASHSAQTNMHAQNLAIVWAPNLLRSRGTEGAPVGGAAFLEVRVQSVVVETLLSHRQRLFCSVFQPSASRLHSDGLSTQNSSAAEETALPPPLEGEVASRSALRLVSLEEAQRAASRSHGALPEDLRTPPTLRRKLHHHQQHHQHHQHHHQESQEQEQQHQDHRPQQDQAENDHHHLHRLNIHPRADSVGSRMVCVGDDYQLDKETKRKKGGLLSFFNRYTQSSRRRRKNSNASDSVQLRGYHGEREAKQQHRLSQSTANLLEAHDLTQHHAGHRLTRSNSIGTLSNSGSTVTESLKEVDAELEEVKESNFTRQNVKDGPKDESTNLHSSLRDAGPGQTSEKSSETQATPSEPPLEAVTDAPCCEDVSMKTSITSTQPTEQDLSLGDSEPLVLEVPKDEPCVDNSVVNGEQRPATGTSLLASAATETAVANVEIVGEAAIKGTTNSNDSKQRVYADGNKTEFDQPNGCNIISRNPSACDDDDDDHCELVSVQIGTGDHVMRASTSADSPERGSSEVTCVATVQNLGSDSAPTDTTASEISALSSQEPLVSASSDTAHEEGDAATQGSREGGSTAPLGSPAATLGCMSASGTEASDEEPTNDSGDESRDLETDSGVPESLTARNDVDLAQAPKTITGALATPETTTCISAEARCDEPETGIVNVDSSASEELSNASRARESSRDASAATASAKETKDTRGSPETNTDMSVDTLPSQEVSRSMSPPHGADMSSAETTIETMACCESDIHPSPYSEVIIDTLPFDASTLITVPTELCNSTSTGAYTDTNPEAPRETSSAAPSNTSTEAATDTSTETSTDTSTEAPTNRSAEAATDTSTEAATDTSTETSTNTFTEAATDTSTEAPTNRSAQAPTVKSPEASTDTSTEASTETPTDTSSAAPTDTSAEAPTDTSTEASTDTSTEASTDTSAEAPTDTSTEASTDTSTETPTGTSTEISTDTSSAAPTDTSAEAPTETSTEASTDTSTETPTDTVKSPAAPSDTSTEASTDTSAETSTDTSSAAPTDTSTETPTDTSTEASTDTSTEASTNTSAETPKDTSTEIPTDTVKSPAASSDTSAETSTDTSAETSTDTSAETPTGTTAETPTDTSTETPRDTSTEAPTDTSTETSTDTSAQKASGTSAKAPFDTSEVPSNTSAESPSGTSAGKPSDTSTEAPSDASAELPSDMPTEAPQHASFVTDMHLSTSSEATVDTSVAGESVQNVFMSTETMTISKVFPRQRNAHHFKPADEQCANQLPTSADEVEANVANADTSHIEEARILNFGYPAVDLELSETDKALLTTTTNILLDIPIDVKIAEDMASRGQRPLPRYGIKVSPRSPSKTIQQGFFYHKYSQALDLDSNRTESSVDADPPCALKHLALQEEGARGMEQRRKCSAMDSKNKCAGEPRTPGLKGNGQFSPESGGPLEEVSCESAEPLGMDGVALQPADTELVRTWVEIRLSKAFPVVRSKPQFTSQLGSR